MTHGDSVTLVREGHGDSVTVVREGHGDSVSSEGGTW